MFQHVPLFKKVLEGRDYVINKKHNPCVFQYDWTPVIITTNESRFPADLSERDREAILQRCYKIACDKKWYSVADKQLELADLEDISKILDARWRA